MLYIDLHPLIKVRGISKLYTFLRQGGFTHHTASNLVNGRVSMLHLAHVERLCELFNCSPHDLLRWEPAGSHLPAASHPLKFLHAPAVDTATVLDDIHNMPLDELRKMTENWKAAREKND